MNNMGNIKHVMRTALVGVKPAKQVMLKGYLRVLLRLEADLEWVSANHPQVDLFMINEDFRSSPNIIKLLQNQPTKPVLYISKDEAHEGGRIVGDSLILPLKEMHQLNAWLFDKVDVLKNQSENHERRESASKSIDNKPKDVKQATTTNAQLDTPELQKKGGFFSSHSEQPQTAKKAQQSASDSEVSEAKYDTLIDIIQCLKEGVHGAYELKIKNEVIAIVEPSRGRAWKDVNSESVIQQNSLINWHIEPTSSPLASDENSIDLKQWLWSVSRNKITELIPLVCDNQSYQLDHWVKPTNQQDRRDILSIMTAMESAANSINKISELANTNLEDSKRVIACLLFSGYLKPDSYNNITLSAANTENKVPASMDYKVTSGESMSPLANVLSKRAAGIGPNDQSTSTIPRNITSSIPAQPKVQPKKEVNSEKLGFLGRLRRKLGL